MKTLLFKNFVRSKGLMLGLLLLFISGLISLKIGKQFLKKRPNNRKNSTLSTRKY
jgi:ABC-2 type transport system permease protein